MGINKNCLGINRSYYANKKYIVHPPRATTSCKTEIILVSFAFDDRVDINLFSMISRVSELASKRTNERSRARERSEQCGLSE